MELGKRLRELRMQREIKQTDLAEYLNCSPGTISNYENGTHFPDLETLRMLADYYGVSTDYLLGRSMLNDKAVSLDQIILGFFTIGDLLWLQSHLSEKAQSFLIFSIKLLMMSVCTDEKKP